MLGSQYDEVMMTDAIDMSYLEALSRATTEDHTSVVLARRYHEGTQDVYLTERVKEFLGLHDTYGSTFHLNVCRGVVTAVTDELAVVGFDTDEVADEQGTKLLSSWAWDVWQDAKMETIQDDVHEAALRDRETFVIVYWDDTAEAVRFVAHNRYTSLEAGGTGQGVWMVYENEDPNQPAICAINQWLETIIEAGGNITSRNRRTIYYPDRIEKWVYAGGWAPFSEEGIPWPIPWVRSGGEPRGIPVFHFKNKGLRPEAWDAIPMQDVINKVLVDIVGTTDLAGFPIMTAFGFIPTTDGQALKTDGSNAMKIEPMRILGSTKSRTEASLDKLEGTDPSPMVQTLKDMILLTAMITDTPASRFNTSGQVAAKETLKEQEKPLQKKAGDRRASFGQAWAACMDMARVLANDFGAAGISEDVFFSTIWQHSESYDELQQKLAFGIPQEQVWAEMGYSQKEIIDMKRMPEYKYRTEKALWEAVAAAGDKMPVETLLKRLGVSDEELVDIGTQRLAAITLQQEDVIPTVEQ